MATLLPPKPPKPKKPVKGSKPIAKTGKKPISRAPAPLPSKNASVLRRNTGKVGKPTFELISSAPASKPKPKPKPPKPMKKFPGLVKDTGFIRDTGKVGKPTLDPKPGGPRKRVPMPIGPGRNVPMPIGPGRKVPMPIGPGRNVPLKKAGQAASAALMRKRRK